MGAALNLNRRAGELCRRFVQDAVVLKVGAHSAPCGTMLVDCGIHETGGLEAGRRLVEICLAGLGQVDLVAGADALGGGVSVLVTTDQPVAACMASQYAGWRITGEKFFAMGSGPMRAAAGREVLFDAIGCREKVGAAVGVLETRQLPPDDVCRDVAAACAVAPDQLTLFLAPTASLAGTVQIVARSVETAMHKLYELGFDLHRVVSGAGSAPLPPASADDLTAIGRTNDAILYGGQVTLWVRGDDASLEKIGPRVPSSASPDFGQPFATIFEHYNRDFYKIDPHLFSPALVTLTNLDSGNAFRFGRIDGDVLARSFAVRAGER